MKSLFAAAPVALLLMSSAHAWDDQGHMMVAAIAWEQLTPTVKARAAALLKLNPDYQSWITGRSDDIDKAAFVQAATWPDFIKSHDHFKNDGEDPSVPGAKLNIGYKDNLQHRYWHYIDLPFSTDGTPTQPPGNPNAETRIELHAHTLASSRAQDQLKSYDMVWLLHLVGDIHQPLHAASRFSADAPGGDRGGNLVTLCDNCSEELHGFWDDVLGTSKSPDAAMRAAARLPTEPLPSPSELDAMAWVEESFELAKSKVYVAPIGEGRGPFTLTDDYKKAAKDLARKRVALAGARLAALLNASLK